MLYAFVDIIIAKFIVPDIQNNVARLQSFKPSYTAIDERFVLWIGHMDINAELNPPGDWDACHRSPWCRRSLYVRYIVIREACSPAERHPTMGIKHYGTRTRASLALTMTVSILRQRDLVSEVRNAPVNYPEPVQTELCMERVAKPYAENDKMNTHPKGKMLMADG